MLQKGLSCSLSNFLSCDIPSIELNLSQVHSTFPVIDLGSLSVDFETALHESL